MMDTSENWIAATDRKDRLSRAKRRILEMKLRGRPFQGAPNSEISPRPQFQDPLSFGQERIWFHHQVEPNSALYHIPLLVKFDGILNVPALEASLNELIRRHEVLRSSFMSRDGAPVQIISSRLTLAFKLVDLKLKEPALQQVEICDRAAAEAHQPFDLAIPPLMRVTLLVLGPKRHALLLTVHHIVWDGWSSGLMIREIRQLYGTFAAGTAYPLEPLVVQYADFAYWQRQLLDSESGKEQIAYWKQQLDGLPPLLTLPTDRPRPAAQGHRGSTYSWNLSPDMHVNLLELGRKNATTLFVTLLAAFTTLLFHYSGQTDIAVGTTIAYRTRPEFEKLIGFFTNALVLRTNLQDNPSFEMLVSRVRNLALEAQANQDVPFEKLVEELAPKRGLTYNPLFQVAFVLHNLPAERLELPDLTIKVEELSTSSAAFDLVLHILDERSGLKARLEYDVDLFDKSTIVRMASHFNMLLQGICSDPTCRFNSLRLLSDEEEKHVLNVSSTKLTNRPTETLLHQLLGSTTTEGAIAVTAGRERLTYGELAARSNQLAHYLRQIGVGPDVPVGIFLEPSVEIVVAILGILKADGAYLPIDPSYPTARIQYVLADSKATAVITTQKLAAALPDSSPIGVLLDADAAVIGSMPASAAPARAKAGNLAYLIYTSGSTGFAKGVMVSHQNAIASTLARQQYYGAPVNAYLLLSSIAFDSSVAGIFWTMVRGGRLCIPTEAIRYDPGAVVRLIEEESISHLLCLPSLYSALLELMSPTNSASLQCSIVAGEECKHEVAARHFDRLPGVSLFNEYGPTECTVWSTVHQIQPGDEAGPVSIGRPVPGAQVYAVSRGGALLPMGVPGELVVGGDGLARGYYNRPDLTAERFVPDPFSGMGTRLYRTGDWGRVRTSGNIEFLGRIDNQVKIRGYRIEPREVEEMLLTHPSTVDTVVVSRPDKTGTARLIAYVVPTSGAQWRDSDVKLYLANRLPDFLVPESIIPLGELPRLPNGKIDRDALPDPKFESARVRIAEPRPLREIELLLADIWREVLTVEEIGSSDNFFDLGGNSLSAIQVIARAQRLFGQEIPITSIFDAGTLEEFAREIERSVAQGTAVNGELDALLAEIEGLPEPNPTEISNHGLEEGKRHA